MSASGISRSSTASKMSVMSYKNLPNLPGVKRSAKTVNPGLYKQYKKSGLLPQLSDEYEDYESLDSYFPDGDISLAGSMATPYPNQASAYNDTSGRYGLISQQQDRLSKSRALPFCRPETVPNYALSEKLICKFLAYFTENVSGHGKDAQHVRTVEISFFLDDNTLEIVEPKTADGGFSQGKLLKRHRVAKPMDSYDAGAFYTIDDFYCGAELNIYNTNYIIVDCDGYTRRYYKRVLKTDFGGKLDIPLNTYSSNHKIVTLLDKNDARASTVAASPTAKRSSNRVSVAEASAGFYEYDRKVLRFYCLWDNRSQLYGDVVKVRLHYSLADDQIEILPLAGVEGAANGRDKLPRYLKKMRVPKNVTSEMSLNPSSSLTAFGVPNEVEYYHWSDLLIGSTFKIASISLKLVDADEFTKNFFASKGILIQQPDYENDFAFDDLSFNSQSLLTSKSEANIRAETANTNATRSTSNSRLSTSQWTRGSTRDSMRRGSTNDLEGSEGMLMVGLAPPIPKRDGLKLVTNSGVILRFIGMIVDGKPGDEKRQFIIQIYLEDDTLQIREPPMRNSGFNGGVFLKRSRMNTATIPFAPSDVYVGADLHILSHHFSIVDADEYTLHYMESNNDWCESDIKFVMAKIKVCYSEI